jgi:hypothetical protein
VALDSVSINSTFILKSGATKILYHVPTIFQSKRVGERNKSHICDDDGEKYNYARSISRLNIIKFRLVQTLSMSNSSTSSIAILYGGKIGYV